MTLNDRLFNSNKEVGNQKHKASFISIILLYSIILFMAQLEILRTDCVRYSRLDNAEFSQHQFVESDYRNMY